jgi:hypothetical protein
MSVLFNIADKIIFGNTVPDYATFRKRVLADGGTITDDAQLKEDMEWVWRYKPSWFASPAVRKVDVLYGAPDLDGTVVRATTKTGINSDGTIGERVAGELPWSYKDGRISFLPESSRTNLLLHSEEFDNAYWGKNASGINTAIGTDGIEPNVAVAPDGAMTADRVNFINQSDPDVGLNKSVGDGVAGNTFTTSFFVKGEGANIGKKVRVRIKRQTGGSGVADTRETTLTGDWQRLDRTITLGAGNTGTATIVSSNTGEATSCLLWGAQLEAGSFASTYIPTTDTALTRNADVLTVTGASGVIGTTAGSLYAEINWTDRVEAEARIVFALQAGSTVSTVRLSVGGVTGQRQLTAIAVDTEQSPVTQAVSQASVGQFPTGFHKMAMRYDATGIQLFVDGVALTLGALTVGYPAVNTITIGHRNSGQFFNDHVIRGAVFNTPLTNAELETLTTI